MATIPNNELIEYLHAVRDLISYQAVDIEAFFVIISEAKIQIDCLNKVTRKI